ncbi:MAG: signal peptidase I [Lachnospirales bacterium]
MKKDFLYKQIKEWLIFIVIFIAMFLFIRNFIGFAIMTNGASMEPTTHHGDRVLVEKFSYILSKPKVNDIIVFPYGEKALIKRIIATENDIVDIKDRYFYINDIKLEDNFSDEVLNLGNVTFPVTVGENEYFVLGDNRNISQDSRYKEVGLIKEKDILGKAVFRFFPFTNMGFLK